MHQVIQAKMRLFYGAISTNIKNYPVSEPSFTGNERDYLLDAFESGWISSKGDYIERFELEFSKYVGTKYGISTSNGTTALHLAIRALGLGRGDEVIVPDLTFASPANAVIYEGAAPVLVDVKREYWGIDPSAVERAITDRTKAVIAVHLYGHPSKMDQLLRICKERDIKLIEDCAEAHGARFQDKVVGSMGDISCFSFYGNKIITTGEGGMALTNDHQLADSMQKLRDHGMSREKRYWHDMVGYNYRLTNLQAAIGLAQLEHIERKISKKRWIASEYAKYMPENIRIQPQMPWAFNVYWIPSFIIEGTANHKVIDFIMKDLLKIGIETRPIFYPLHQMPPYFIPSTFPISEYVSNHGISLPSLEWLTEDDIAFISETLAGKAGKWIANST